MEQQRGTLEEYIDAILRCSFCLEYFTDPKSLPCLHTFCLKCITSHCNSRGSDPSKCPVCRKELEPPPGSASRECLEKLPGNFVFRDLLGIVKNRGQGRDNTDNNEGEQLFRESTLREDVGRVDTVVKEVEYELRSIVRRQANFRSRIDAKRDAVNAEAALALHERVKQVFDKLMTKTVYEENVDHEKEKHGRSLTAVGLRERLQLTLGSAQSFLKFAEERLKKAETKRSRSARTIGSSDVKSDEDNYREMHSRAEDIVKQAEKIKRNIEGNETLDEIHCIMLEHVEGLVFILFELIISK